MSRCEGDPRVVDHGNGIVEVHGARRTVEVHEESQYGAWRIVRPDAPADDFRQTRDAAIERAFEVAA
jgi:hypothetical protein